MVCPGTATFPAGLLLRGQLWADHAVLAFVQLLEPRPQVITLW